MITLTTNRFDILNIESELDLKVGGIKELSSPTVLEELSNAVFTLSGKAFIKAMNLEARANPKRYHHIYEWNKTGNPSGRLFFLYKERFTNGTLIIKPGFIQSKSKVPIDPALLSPGRTGKTVSSRYVFKDKARVMEDGSPVIYRTTRPTPMVIDGSIKFVSAGTIIKNLNPGGKEVRGSFEKFYHMWFATKVNSVIESSGIIENIDREVASILNKKKSGPAQVRTAIINLLRQYSKNEGVL